MAAWKPPGQSRFEVMPAKAFVPVARFQVVGAESGPGKEVTYLERQSVGQSNLLDWRRRQREPSPGGTVRLADHQPQAEFPGCRQQGR